MEDNKEERLKKERDTTNKYRKSHREKVNQYVNKSALKKREFLQGIKQQPCKDCGHSFPHYVMEFDHVRGQKKRPVSQMSCRNWNTILIELEKCDVVCANCHCIRTFVRKQLKTN